VDAYGESEQVLGLFTMIEDNLDLPFVTKVLGLNVTVEKVGLSSRDDIIVICRQGPWTPVRSTRKSFALPAPDSGRSGSCRKPRLLQPPCASVPEWR